MTEGIISEFCQICFHNISWYETKQKTSCCGICSGWPIIVKYKMEDNQTILVMNKLEIGPISHFTNGRLIIYDLGQNWDWPIRITYTTAVYKQRIEYTLWVDILARWYFSKSLILKKKKCYATYSIKSIYLVPMRRWKY